MRRTLVFLVVLLVAPLLQAQSQPASSQPMPPDKLQELTQILLDYKAATSALQSGFDQYKQDTDLIIKRQQNELFWMGSITFTVTGALIGYAAGDQDPITTLAAGLGGFVLNWAFHEFKVF